MRIRPHRPHLDSMLYRWFHQLLRGFDRAYFMWYGKGVGDSTKAVRVIRGFRDTQNRKCRPGQIVMAVFSPEPGDDEGVCYPLFFSGVKLKPEDYEFVLLERDYEKLLKG